MACGRLIDQVRQLNLFVNAKTRVDQDGQVLRDQIISTRLYLMFLLVSFLVLASFVLSSTTTERIILNKPSFASYQHLYSSFSETLSCPCTEITIPYSSFLIMKTTYHQVGR